MRAIMAHQGGWDEFLFFAVPVVLGIVALRIAEQRAKRRRSEGAATDAETAEPGDGAGDR